MDPENKLLKQYFKSNPFSIAKLKGDGSSRCIYRVQSETASAIYVQSPNIIENKDFIFLTEILKAKGIPVPNIYLVDDEFSDYLIEDLGKHTLAELLYGDKVSDKIFVINAYKKVILHLIEMQDVIKEPLKSFLIDRQMGLDIYKSDLNYFIAEFLDQFQFRTLMSSGVNSELNQLINGLLSVNHQCFVYRDFQSRNFMWVDDNPVFIDYQAAMLGTIYYDLGSLLFSSQSGLSQQERNQIIEFYYVKKQLNISYTEFINRLYCFILLRRLRSLGSYGFLSRKGKTHFAGYIPQALKELTLLFDQGDLSRFKYIRKMLRTIYDEWVSNPSKYI